MSKIKQEDRKEVVPDPISALLDGVEDWQSAAGSDKPHFATGLILAALNSVRQNADASDEDAVYDFHRTAEGLKGIAPTNEVEGMLAVQMLCTHNAAMECVRKAMLPGQFQEASAHYLKMSDKFMRTFTLQMEALNRYRGKGQQQIVVKHVSVNEGGQAVVGTVNRG